VYLYSLSRQTYPYIIIFFLHMYDYAILDSEYCETSGYVGGFDPEDV
jgi:hypothetical protein